MLSINLNEKSLEIEMINCPRIEFPIGVDKRQWKYPDIM